MRGLIRIVLPAGALVIALLAPATGQAGGTPAIAWTSPLNNGSYDYGAVRPGQTASQTFTLTNSGGSATGMLSIARSGSSAFSITSDACTGTALGKAKSCAVTIQYAPTTAGESDAATLTASGKKPPASASISLTGAGVGDLSLSPGSQVGTTDTGTNVYVYDNLLPFLTWRTTFTVTNNGTDASNQLILAGCCEANFVLGNNNCDGQSLAPNGTCTFDLTWEPPLFCVGDYGTQLDVNTQDNGSPYIHLTAFAHCPFIP